jgi:hypothetical protein
MINFLHLIQQFIATTLSLIQLEGLMNFDTLNR